MTLGNPYRKSIGNGIEIRESFAFRKVRFGCVQYPRNPDGFPEGIPDEIMFELIREAILE